jgi:hypothetical protein
LSCRKIAEGEHPDILVLAPKGKLNIIPIDDVRELKEVLSLRPYEGKLKVAIIRGAERFRAEAGSALLKTLEEPTLDTSLLLTAESESSVMETIVSRCVRIKVPPLSRHQIKEALDRKGLPLKSGHLMAGLSGGALGAALRLDPNQILTLWEDIDQIFGNKDPMLYVKTAYDWTASFAAELEKADKQDDDSAHKIELRELALNTIRLWWRDVAVLAATGNLGALLGPPPSASQKYWAQKITSRILGHLEKSMAKLEDGLNRALKPAILFENYWLDVLDCFK